MSIAFDRIKALPHAARGGLAGSNAGLTQTTTLTPHLVPDKIGPWQVKFTACPSFCTVASPSMRIAPIIPR